MFEPKKEPTGNKPRSRPKKLYLELTWKQNEVAMENLRRYCEWVSNIMGDLESKGQLDGVLRELHLRNQWQKRFVSNESRVAKRKHVRSTLHKKRRGN